MKEVSINTICEDKWLYTKYQCKNRMFRINRYTQSILFFLKRVVKADIVKVFSLTSISTLVRMLTGMISVKIVASVIGPAGVALVGQLNNFSTIVLNLSSCGINGGITKYVAEYRNDKERIVSYVSTAFRITAYCSLITGFLMIVLHRYISNLIMLSDEYGYVFIIFGFTILLYAFNNMLTSILNGYKEFKIFVKLNIISTLVGLVFSVSLVLLYGVKGALVSAVTYQSVMIFVSFWMLRKLPWFNWSYFSKKIDSNISKEYFQYSVMTLVSIAVVPISQMFLRGYVISEISSEAAGCWEGMNRISNMYLSVITSSFGVYYLPRLSELHDNKSLHNEIIKSYKVIVPLLLGGLTFVYIIRSYVINILFTPEFASMKDLFIWQQIGDFFKISSWLLAYLMVAKSKTILYTFTEILASSLYVIFGVIFVRLNGVVGITQAYMINYIIYMGVMAIAFRKVLIGRE